MLTYKETYRSISHAFRASGAVPSRSAGVTFDHLVFHLSNSSSLLSCPSFDYAPSKVYILLNTKTCVVTHFLGNIDVIRTANFVCSLN